MDHSVDRGSRDRSAQIEPIVVDHLDPAVDAVTKAPAVTSIVGMSRRKPERGLGGVDLLGRRRA